MADNIYQKDEQTFGEKVEFYKNVFFGDDVTFTGKLNLSSSANLTLSSFNTQNLNAVGISTFDDITINGKIYDGDGNFGTTGQVLSSDGVDTKWINASSANVGSASAVGTNLDATNANQFISFVGSTSGNNPIRVDGDLTYNPSTNTMSGINYSGTSTFNNIDVNGTAIAATLEVEGQLRDGDGNFGSAGQVLSSDGTDTKWITTNNTTYTYDSVASGSDVNLRLIGSDGTTDNILLTAGSNITVSSVSTSGFTLSATDTNTTYTYSAIASGSNVNLRLQGNDGSSDDVVLTAGSNITVSSVSTSGFTLSATDTNTTYTYDAVASGSNVNLRLIGSDGTNDDVLLTAGTDITFSNVNSSGLTINAQGLKNRTTASASTSSIANDVAANISFTIPSVSTLLKLETSAAAWVTLYYNSASRTADATRSIYADPVAGLGVLAEVVTTGAETIGMSPAPILWNNDSTPADTIYAKVVNRSGSTQAITVTATYLQNEK